MVAVDPPKGFLYVITKEHPTLDKAAIAGQVAGAEAAEAVGRRYLLP